jgi:predicted enzyme related to lactoylglutathione lyase
LDSVVFDSADPSRLARWWSETLGWSVSFEDEEEVDVAAPVGLAGLREVPTLIFVPVDDAKSVKNRLHLDLASESSDDQEATVARLVARGARPVDIGQRGVPWVVLADPEDNEFCVLEPRDRYRGTGSLASIVLNAVEPEQLAGFWEKASGWTLVDRQPGGVSLRRPSGAPPDFDVVRAEEPHVVKNRVHLDVAPLTADGRDAEVKRLLEAGAGPADVGQGAKVTWVVLADPEGNEFCVLRGH